MSISIEEFKRRMEGVEKRFDDVVFKAVGIAAQDVASYARDKRLRQKMPKGQGGDPATLGVVSGDLIKSFRGEARKEKGRPVGVVLAGGSIAPYAVYHEEGGPKIPKRAVFEQSVKANLDKTVETIETHLTRAIEEALG